MFKTSTLPSCVHFNRAIWNSEPFIENFLYDWKARKYYLLDESDCRHSLINLFSILDFWTLQTENQASIRTILSSLCTILALNLRELNSVPLVDTFAKDEFATDPDITQRFEKPISKWNQVSEEIQNAVRSIDRFDVIAPALAWGLLRFSIGGIPVLKTIHAELERWKLSGVTIQLPRGCLAFLDRKLPLVKNFSFLPVDLTTLVKATGVFLGNKHIGANGSLFKKQLSLFTKCFIEKNLGAWIPFEEITNGNGERRTALIEAFLEVNDDKQLSQSFEILSRLHENFAKPLDGFSLEDPQVYSVYKGKMLNYLCSTKGQNDDLSAKFYDIRNALLEISASGFEETETKSNTRQIAEVYLEKLPPSQKTHDWMSIEAAENSQSVVLAAQVSGKAAKKKKKRRRKKD